MKHMLRVASKFTPIAPVRRYLSDGVYSDYETRAKFKRFSSDVKRKSAAYDRVGYSLAEAESGMVTLEGGDILVFGKDTSRERMFLAGFTSDSFVHLEDDPSAPAPSFEALFCNTRVNILNGAFTQDPITMQPNFDEGATPLFSNIPASMAPLEMFITEPLDDVKDHYLLRLPEVLPVGAGNVVRILSTSPSYNQFEHAYYRVVHPEPSTLGVSTYRVKKDLSGHE